MVKVGLFFFLVITTTFGCASSSHRNIASLNGTVAPGSIDQAYGTNGLLAMERPMRVLYTFRDSAGRVYLAGEGQSSIGVQYESGQGNEYIIDRSSLRDDGSFRKYKIDPSLIGRPGISEMEAEDAYSYNKTSVDEKIVTRLLSDGTIDRSFGKNGSISVKETALAWLVDGKYRFRSSSIYMPMRYMGRFMSDGGDGVVLVIHTYSRTPGSYWPTKDYLLHYNQKGQFDRTAFKNGFIYLGEGRTDVDFPIVYSDGAVFQTNQSSGSVNVTKRTQANPNGDQKFAGNFKQSSCASADGLIKAVDLLPRALVLVCFQKKASDVKIIAEAFDANGVSKKVRTLATNSSYGWLGPDHIPVVTQKDEDAFYVLWSEYTSDESVRSIKDDLRFNSDLEPISPSKPIVRSKYGYGLESAIEMGDGTVLFGNDVPGLELKDRRISITNYGGQEEEQRKFGSRVWRTDNYLYFISTPKDYQSSDTISRIKLR